MLPESFNRDLLRQLELLKLQGRRAFLGSRQGGHLSLKRGHGIEFSDYRQYELGDNPRHIDWGVYARSDRLYIKRFQEEQDLPVLLLLDTSSSMTTPAAERKWERARDVALAIAYVALMQQDSVRIGVLGRFVSPNYYGARAIHQVGDLLLGVAPGGQVDFPRAVRDAASQVRFPGVAIMISDFLLPFDQIQAAFGSLRAKNLDITAIQVLSESDRNPLAYGEPVIAVDSEDGREIELMLDDQTRAEYDQLLERHTARLTDYFAESRIGFSRVHTNEALDAYLVRGLTTTGLLR